MAFLPRLKSWVSCLGGTYDQIGSFLGKTGRTISDYIADIRAEQTAIRDEIIYRLSLLGWTGEETAEVTGLSRQRIEQIATSGNISKISNSIGEWLGKKRSVEEAAKKLEISAALAWAIHLQDVEDEKRMDKLSITVKKYTSWNYVSAHPLMGKESFNGRIPGDIIVNFLYWFTKQNDLVVDPMAGSGTTADACLLMGRRCYAFDLRNETERKDVRVNNILDGYPDVVKRKKVDAIFVNPPYWGLVNYDEREDNQKVEGELSAIPLQEYYSAIEKFAKDSYAVLKQDGHLGIIIADQTTRIAISKGLLKKKDVGMALDHCGSIHRYFENAGFLFNTRILCAMPTEGLDNFMRAENEWHQPANITRELLVYIKK